MTRHRLAVLLASACAFSAALPAVADDGPLMVRTAQAKLKLIERESRLVDLPDNITLVTDFDDTVIGIDPISPTRVRVTATKPGRCGHCPRSSPGSNFRSEDGLRYPCGRVTARVVS